MKLFNNEQVLYITFDKQPQTRDRNISPKDKFLATKDKQGNIITLEADKKLYPFKIDNSVKCTIVTTVRTIEFTIPNQYRWNGADIPKFMWALVGSRYNPEFKIPSMVHDIMLEFKEDIYSKLTNISVAEYRRLTSLIFRQLLKDKGVGTIKSNIMSGAVQCYQTLFNRKGWQIG